MSDLVRINADDALEYSESLSLIGQGWWRQIAWAFRQGIPDALGLDRREWAETYHGYLRLPIPDRREAVAELAAEGLNNSEIADALGVSRETVARDLGDRTNVQSDEPEDAEVLVEEPDSEPDRTDVQFRDEDLETSVEKQEDHELTAEEKEEGLRESERLAAIRRGQARLLALVDGWIELTALPTNPLRDALLEGLNTHDRQIVQEIEALYQEVGK